MENIPETKHIGNGVYEFRSGNFVLMGSKPAMNEIDKEMMNQIKKMKK